MIIENKMARIYKAEGVSLKPGSNDVNEARAKRFLANKGVMARVSKGVIVPAEAAVAATESASTETSDAAEDDEDAAPAADADTDMTEDEILACTDLDVLKALAAGDGRTTETKAAKTRLAELTAE